MRSVIHRTVPNLVAPDAAILAQARLASARGEGQERFLAQLKAFDEIEQAPPSPPRPWPGRLRLAALNTERLKNRPAVRQLMQQSGIDIALFSEVDVGMARSGNVHTIRDLIGDAGEGYLFGVEFVELDLGDEEESRKHAGASNSRSLHGNAIVTGLALEAPHLIPLEESGRWFSGFEGRQRRIGGRMALAARIAGAPRPLWVVSLHLESKTDPADRQSQIRHLLRALDDLAPNEACIIGGDCNTKALPREAGELHRLMQEPERYEPLFADLRDAGFSWADANLALPTQRDGPAKTHSRPFGKLDWLFVRGVAVESPQVVPSLDEKGQPFSDHDMVVVDIVL